MATQLRPQAHLLRRSILTLVLGSLEVSLVLTGCVQVQPKPDFDRARVLVEETTGAQEVFDPYAPSLTELELDAIFADGLSLEEALRLALINNREIQADFQEIGVAHAEWVQSQLLSNPSLDGLLRFPTDGGRTMIEAILSMELLQLWRIPVRKETANQNLEATVLRIARRSGERFAEARNAYHSAVAAAELYRVAEENTQLAKMSYEAVKNLHEAGAADAFDESLAHGPLLSAQLARRTARFEASNAMRLLAKRLSIESSVDDLVLTDSLPQPAPEKLDPDTLVDEALAARLDLKAIAAAIRSLEARERLERGNAWGNATVGTTVERPAGSGEDSLVGPSLSLTLPLFDQNQAQIARAGFKRQQMIKLYESARIAVAQDVRSNVDRAKTASQSLVFYQQELLPQSERSLALARDSFAAGRTTLLSLVEVQRQLLEARRGYVTVCLEAATSYSELERVLGMPLVASKK